MKIIKLISAGMLLTAAYFTVKATPSFAPGPERGSRVFNVSTPGNDMQSSAQDKKIKSFKREWNRKIDGLNANIGRDERKIKKLGIQAQVKLNEEISDLKVKRDELKKEIDAAGNHATDNWDEFQQDVKDKYAVLNKKVKDFFRR